MGGVTAVSFPATVGPACVLFIRAAIHHGRMGSRLSLPMLWLSDEDGGQNSDCQFLIRRPPRPLSHKQVLLPFMLCASPICMYVYVENL